MASNSLEELVVALLPSLSRSPAEEFNVFRVMHHGTHEKQISNVFAWLLDECGTHGLGGAFQKIFVEEVNRGVTESLRLPTSGYRVAQEVDTSGGDADGKDIADIVLSHPRSEVAPGTAIRLVVEHFEFSDGHGHSYENYRSYAVEGGGGLVVLLCEKEDPKRISDGWQAAVVVTYAQLLKRLEEHVEADDAWPEAHPEQAFFLEHMVKHFMRRRVGMTDDERITFIKAMCDTGESKRYGHRPHAVAAKAFVDELAERAEKHFEEGREMLARAKRSLKSFAELRLIQRVNESVGGNDITEVHGRFVGRWEWCVALIREDPKPDMFLEFGPTAVEENQRAPVPLVDPDYTRVFVTRRAPGHDGIDLIIQTDVGLADVLAGLDPDDTRLCEAVFAASRAT